MTQLSRRGFLGGCFAAAATSALSPGGVHAEPRSWLSSTFRVIKDPASIIRIAIWTGARSDGMHFFHRIGVEDEQEAEAVKEILRHRLDGYLNSMCDCRPGFDCKIHGDQDDEMYAEWASIERPPTKTDKHHSSLRKAMYAL